MKVLRSSKNRVVSDHLTKQPQAISMEWESQGRAMPGPNGVAAAFGRCHRSDTSWQNTGQPKPEHMALENIWG